MTTKLEIRGLSKVYGDRPQDALKLANQGRHPKEILAETGQMVAVSGVSVRVEKGEIFTIMGLSGSGKSTLVRCLNRLIEPTAGSILIDGEDICAKTSDGLRQLRRTKIAMVFQNFALLPHKTVVENVEFGLKLRGETPASRRLKANQVLDKVGLTQWANRLPNSLSGGMKQRVGLARALANEPDILLMDEPFSALDPLIRTDLQEELLKLQREIKKTIIFVTHDFHEAVKLSSKIAVMRDGQFVQVGTPQEILLRPADDYVLKFAREVDRAQIITAGDIARFGSAPISCDMSAQCVLDLLRSSNRLYGIIQDAFGIPVGMVCRAQLEKSCLLDGRSAMDCTTGQDVISLPATTTLSALYPHFSSRMPLAILDATGAIAGTLDANDVLTHLGALNLPKTVDVHGALVDAAASDDLRRDLIPMRSTKLKSRMWINEPSA